MKSANQVFLDFLDFSSVPRFSSFLIVASHAVVLDVCYLFSILKEEYTIYSNIIIVLQLHMSLKNARFGPKLYSIRKGRSNQCCPEEQIMSTRGYK